MSPAFPRTIASRITTPPQMPEGLAQWGLSGKGQFRAFDNAGRIWEEVYPAIDLLTANGRALLMEINRGLREKLIWTIQHPHYKTNFGVGGGAPLVKGADQTGNSIIIDAAPTTLTNWLRAGDIIKFAGLQLVYDVAADVDTDSLGEATIPIHPPIFAGQSPANNAVVTIAPASIFFSAVIIALQMPDIEAHGVIAPGMTLVWREQPS